MDDDWSAPHLAQVHPYVPGRTPEEVARAYGVADASKLASNENPLGPSPRALRAAAEALGQTHRYPDDTCGPLRERLAALHGVRTDELAFGHGSNELIDLLCRTVAGPGTHGVIGHPSFVAYGLALQTTHTAFTRVPLRGGIHWDLDAMLEAVTRTTRILYLDSPNNPTSTHVPRDAMRRFLSAVPEHVLVVADEAYHHFVDAPDYESALHMRDLRDRLVVLRTFSKAYGLAGLRVGYGVGPAQLIDRLMRVRLPFNVNAAAQAAAVAALDDDAHLDGYLQLNRTERARLTAALSERGFVVASSQANFLHVTAPEGVGDLEQVLLRAGVIVRPVDSEGRRLRISIGLPADNDRLLRALTAIA